MAFIGASAADDYGNCTSQIGPNACGSMGYSFVDAHNAGCVVVVTDNLVDYPCCPVSISQQYVDYVSGRADEGAGREGQLRPGRYPCRHHRHV